MPRLLYKYIIRPIITLFVIQNLQQFMAFAENKESVNLEGYRVKFDYQNYPEEREIAYQYFKSKFNSFSDNHPLLKNEIGIDLYDMNNNGKKEILSYLFNSNYCGSRGCPFEIFKINHSLNDQEYKPLYLNITARDNIKILNSSTKGYHDINFDETIWVWDGQKYQFNKILNEKK